MVREKKKKKVGKKKKEREAAAGVLADLRLSFGLAVIVSGLLSQYGSVFCFDFMKLSLVY